MAMRPAAAASASPGDGAPPPAPTPSSSLSINALPPEILWQIFSYFALEPLLLAVSLVCKRWRTAALNSVTELTTPTVEKIDLAAFPRLRKLDVRQAYPDNAYKPLKLPTTLRELVIKYSSVAAFETIGISRDRHLPLPSLTSLDFLDEPDALHLLCLIRCSETSLTSLAIRHDSALHFRPTRFSQDDEVLGKMVPGYFAGAKFPALAHLEIEVQWDEALGALLEAHASQLTSLDACYLPPPALRLSFPKLHTLRVESPEDANSLAEFCALAPRLTRLDGLPVQILLNAAPTWPTLRAVRELHVNGSDNVNALVARLPCLPNLTAITAWSLTSVTQLTPLLHPHYATKLHALLLDAPLNAATRAAVYEHCTNLRELHIPHGSEGNPPPHPSPTQSLPHLHTLGFEHEMKDAQLVYACLRAYLARCPRLQDILIGSKDGLTVADIPAFTAFVAEMGRRPGNRPQVRATVTPEMDDQRRLPREESFGWVHADTVVCEEKKP